MSQPKSQPKQDLTTAIRGAFAQAVEATDPEITAMNAIRNALQPLSPLARDRVIAWTIARFQGPKA